jgi:hypothetical protein
MLSVKQLRAIQKLGEQMFVIYVTIYRRRHFAFDDDNPYGDDTVTFETTPTRVKGWLYHGNRPSDPVIDAGQAVSVEHVFVRIPVGTVIEAGDKVFLLDEEYRCGDANVEQTWPEWLLVQLIRVHR